MPCPPRPCQQGARGVSQPCSSVTHQQHRHSTRRSWSPTRPQPYGSKPTPAWAAGATGPLFLSPLGKGHTAPTTAPTATASGVTRLPRTAGVLRERKVPVFTGAGHCVPCSNLICSGDRTRSDCSPGWPIAPGATTAFRLLERCRGPDSL